MIERVISGGQTRTHHPQSRARRYPAARASATESNRTRFLSLMDAAPRHVGLW
jgi:hypothetical protein